MSKKWTFVFALALLAAPHAYATNDGEGGFASVMNIFFGDESGRNGSASCNQNGNIGLMGQVNMIFCHLENDMGIKTTGNATKTFSNNGTSTTVKCSVTANAAGATYANTAACWVCTGASCSNFSRLMNLQWTYASGGANTGTLVMDNGAFNGTAGNGEYFTWDVGASTATKNVTAKAKFTNGGQSFQFAVTAKKTGSVRQASMVMNNGSASYAFEMSTDTSANVALAVFQSGGGSCTSGFDGLSGTATAADTGCAVCYTRASSGSDFTYTQGGNCSSLSLLNLPDSSNNVGAYTVGTNNSTDVLTGAGAISQWNGMAATPSF